MREFKKRGRGDIVLFCVQVFGVLLLFVVAVGAVRAAWGMYTKLAKADKGQQEAEVQLAALAAQRQKVAASVEDLSSERGVEAQIRQRYGVVRPGEGEIEIVRDSAVATSTTKPQPRWWQSVFRALFVW